MDLIEALKNLGFTKQESIIYITLCKYGELNGYEVSKYSGISRSNAYSSLATLVEKGGAYVDQMSTTKYIATPKDELLMNFKRSFDNTIDYLDNNLTIEKYTLDPYITILGKKNCINKIKNIILKAEKRIYISCNIKDLLLFKSELLQATNKQIKIVIISPKNINIDNSIFYSSPKEIDTFKLIADTKEVITGNLKIIENTQCLYSKNLTLVKLIRESFINEIELIKVYDNR